MRRRRVGSLPQRSSYARGWGAVPGAESFYANGGGTATGPNGVRSLLLHSAQMGSGLYFYTPDDSPQRYVIQGPQIRNAQRPGDDSSPAGVLGGSSTASKCKNKYLTPSSRREDLSGAEAIDPGQRPVGRQKKQQPKTLRRVEKWVDVPNLPTERMRNQTG